MAKNVLGTLLIPCSTNPVTGFMRDGCCGFHPQDIGRHTVCAEMTDEFLAYSKAQGNDLSTPQPDFDFPGLHAGDRWCLCARRWLQASEAGYAPPVVLESCDESCLEVISLADLMYHALR